MATAAPLQAAVSVDFRQDANNDGGFDLGEAHWINSIVQASNAVYFEGMGLAQRVVLKDLPGTNAAGTQHSLTFGHQWTKGSIHAFDMLMSWEQAEATGTAELSTFLNTPILQQIIAFKDGDEIAASMLPVSTSLTNGANFFDVEVPDDAYQSANGPNPVPPAQRVPVQPRIDDFEAAYGNRTIRVFADAPILSANLTLSHSVPNGGDTGDSFVNYTLTWTTAAKSTQAVIWMAAHIAVGNDSDTLLNLVPGGWGLNKGASQINGGPYHFTLDRADGVQLGSQDNQLKGSSVRALPECDISGPALVCPNSTNQYSTSSSDPAATFSWSLPVANGASIVGSTTGTSVQVLSGGCDTSYRICVTVTDSTGLSNTCCIDVTVDDNTAPTASNPDPVTVDCIEDVPAPDVTVVDDEADNCDSSPTVTHIGDVSDGNTCPEVITRTYRVTDDCGNTKDVTQTITVDDNTPPTVTCASQATVTIAAPTATDNCTGTPTTTSSRSDGKPLTDPYPIGTPVTVTFTVTDACGNTSTCTYVVSITGP